LKEKAQMEVDNSLDHVVYLGQARNKI